jgi:hypothetical protein
MQAFNSTHTTTDITFRAKKLQLKSQREVKALSSKGGRERGAVDKFCSGKKTYSRFLKNGIFIIDFH